MSANMAGLTASERSESIGDAYYELARRQAAGNASAAEIAAAEREIERRSAEAQRTAVDYDQHQPPLWQPFAPPDHVPDRQWLIEPWLPLGRLSMLASAGGGGKSTLALQLALAVTGEHGVWLPHAPPAAAEDEGMLGIQTAVDRTAVVRRPVVYASYEDELSEVYRRYHHIRATHAKLGADGPDHGGRLHYVDLALARDALWAPQLDDQGRVSIWSPGAYTALGKWLLPKAAAAKAALLVIDTHVAAYAANENANREVRAWLLALDHWARTHTCTVLLIHHTAKGRPDEGPRGASDFTNAARAVLTLGTGWPDHLTAADTKPGGEHERPWSYLKLDKGNYTPPAGSRGGLSALTGWPDRPTAKGTPTTFDGLGGVWLGRAGAAFTQPTDWIDDGIR